MQLTLLIVQFHFTSGLGQVAILVSSRSWPAHQKINVSSRAYPGWSSRHELPSLAVGRATIWANRALALRKFLDSELLYIYTWASRSVSTPAGGLAPCPC